MVSGLTATLAHRISHGGIDVAAAVAAASGYTNQFLVRMAFRLVRIAWCVAIVLILFTILSVMRIVGCVRC